MKALFTARQTSAFVGSRVRFLELRPEEAEGGAEVRGGPVSRHEPGNTSQRR